MNYKTLIFKRAWFLYKTNQYSNFRDALIHSWAIHKSILVIDNNAVTNAYNEVSINLQKWVMSNQLYSIYGKSLSQDFVHDTFLKVLEKIHTFNPEKSTLKTWIFNICKNLIIDNSRSNMNKFNSKLVSIDAANDDFDLIVVPDKTRKSDKSIYNGIIQTINGLKETYKSVAMLRFVHQKQLNEIAEELGMPINTVKVTVMRCKEILQPKLEMYREM